MDLKAGFRPESEEALSMTQEEAQRNDLTRLERFKKWAKENIAGVSAVAISVDYHKDCRGWKESRKTRRESCW